MLDHFDASQAALALVSAMAEIVIVFGCGVIGLYRSAL